MFGLELIKHKRRLGNDFSDCFSPVKDQLGNVPVEIQYDVYVNGFIVEICKSYFEANNVRHKSSQALILDFVFEEIYRRDSIKVQNYMDGLMSENAKLFKKAQEKSEELDDYDSRLDWLNKYVVEHFEPAKNIML